MYLVHAWNACTGTSVYVRISCMHWYKCVTVYLMHALVQVCYSVSHTCTGTSVYVRISCMHWYKCVCTYLMHALVQVCMYLMHALVQVCMYLMHALVQVCMYLMHALVQVCTVYIAHTYAIQLSITRLTGATLRYNHNNIFLLQIALGGEDVILGADLNPPLPPIAPNVGGFYSRVLANSTPSSDPVLGHSVSSIGSECTWALVYMYIHSDCRVNTMSIVFVYP